MGLRTGAPPSTPTRGVPSGHLGGAPTPFLAHWLHHDGYGGGQPLVVHLRREEEVISADDGHAESGCSAEEGAQRVAAARLGAGGVARGGGTPACPRSSQPHTQAEPRTAGREFWRVSQGRAWRVTNRGDTRERLPAKRKPILDLGPRGGPGPIFGEKGPSARAYARSRSVLQLCRKGRRDRRGPFPGLCGHLPASVTGREAPRVRRRGCISNAPH